MNLKRLIVPAIGLLVGLGSVPADAETTSSGPAATSAGVVRDAIRIDQSGFGPLVGGGIAVRSIGPNLVRDPFELVLDMPGWAVVDWVPVQVWNYRTPDGADLSNQRWDFINIGNNMYLIQNRFSRKCLEKSWANDNSVTVYQITCNNQAENQLWWVDGGAGGGQRLHSERDDDRCLDISNFGGAGTQMQVYSCGDGWNQSWWFTIE
jgi:hypothetical protein